MVKKNIKTEKFSFYTFLLILCILFGLLIAGALRDALFEYLPKTNLFGDSDIAKESKIRIYNEGDIFRPFFAILFWVTASMVIIFIVNYISLDNYRLADFLLVNGKYYEKPTKNIRFLG